MELKDLLLQPDESQRALDLADEPDLPLAVADAFAENPDEDVVALVPKSPPKPLKPLKDGELVLLDLCCFEPFFLLAFDESESLMLLELPTLLLAESTQDESLHWTEVLKKSKSIDAQNMTMAIEPFIITTHQSALPMLRPKAESTYKRVTLSGIG